MSDYHLIINGEKVNGGNQDFDVLNPANETVYGTCPSATDTQLDEAVSAAQNAFKTWSKTSCEQRAALLHKVANKVEENATTFAEIIVKEQGKPMFLSQVEVGASVAWIRYTADLEIPVETIEDSETRLVQMHRKPLGVIGSITPWNWPFMIAIWHIMPAIRAGNTLVCKPSSNTPFNTLKLVELMNEVLPKGVINIVAGGSGLGSKMSKHAGINKIAFTGSTPTGKSIMSDASQSLKRLTLELGGNDAGIILPNSQNIEAMTNGIFQSSFLNMGQTCASLKRLYVHEDQYNEVCDSLVNIAKVQNIGDGMQEKTTFGPVQNQVQFDLVHELVEDAKENGAKILHGGEALKQKGFYYPPTIIADVDNSFRVVSEEQFGPILPVIKYQHIEEAIEMANDSEVGLGGSVWGEHKEAIDVAHQLECGTSWINNHSEVLPHIPFGGSKQSGYGIEFGQEGLLEFTQSHVINITK